MMHDLFQNRYRIPSARATWHNYNGGIYFVTICTRGQEQYFGEISNSEMHLSEIGHYANEQIRNVQTHYPYAQIPLWVVMPNHLHAIVVIDSNNVPYERRGVETWRAASHMIAETQNVTSNMISETQNAASIMISETQHDESNMNIETWRAASLQGRHIANMQGWLSVVVGGIKSAVTKFANQNKILFSWQSRFHDHIIRKTDELNRIADYIENNVLRWEQDKFYR